MDIQEFRTVHPQYTDLSDQDLADRLYKKHYSDMSRPEFNKKFGVPETWGSAALGAVESLPSSAVQFGADIVQPIVHPIETVTGLKNLGLGVLEKTNLLPSHEHEKYADAVGKFLVDRYGSMDAVKHTLATDPVGLVADLSTLLTGGESALIRAPAAAGRVAELTAAAGRTAGAVGRAMDPLTVGTRAVGKGAPYLLGMTTHTGEEAIRRAAEAGYEGGPRAEAFQRSMRGQEEMEKVVAEARTAVGNMRKQRGDEYRAAMQAVQADQTILDFSPINAAYQKMLDVKSFKGRSIDPATADIREKLGTIIGEWSILDPKEFHTAEGLDAMKQEIGSVRDATQYGTPERKIADDAYHAVRKVIVDQVPSYAKTMQAYEDASDLIKQIEHSLSVNPKANVDTTLRKLQSVLRNNVHTNYGYREKLAEYLVQNGSPYLMEKLAGQAMSSVTPRGFGKLVASEVLAALAGVFVGGALHGGGLSSLAAAAAPLPVMSPRLVGEAAYYTGKGVRQAERVQPQITVPWMRQTGRAALGAGAGSPLVPPQSE